MAFKIEWRRNEGGRRDLTLGLFLYRLMNELAEEILVLVKIVVPKPNMHERSVLQFGFDSTFAQPLDPRFWVSYAKPNTNEVLLGRKVKNLEEAAWCAQSNPALLVL